MNLPEPLWNKKVLSSDGSIIVSDLHIGYERELEKKGVNIPSQTYHVAESITEILEENSAEQLIINGDLKHNIPMGSWQEYKEIPKALDKWLKVVDNIHLLPGNHDGNINRYIPSDVIVHSSKGAVINGIGLFHGHAYPSKEVLKTEKLIIGHNHPTIFITDSLGNKKKRECWIRLDYRYEEFEGEAILMPHFNPLLGGNNINDNGYIGPFLKNCEKENERVYLLDGTFLGHLNDLTYSSK